MSKWKGQVVSFAPSVSASLILTATTLISLASPGFAQDASYTFGDSPTLSSYGIVSPVYQEQLGDLDAVISNNSVASTTTGTATAPLATDLTDTTVTASVTSNKSTGTLDISGVTGTGATSNAILSNALETLTNNAYAAITNTDITNTSTTPADGSVVGLSDNSLTAAVTLGTSSNQLSGALSTSFANSDVGTSALDPNSVAAALDPATATGTAGLLLQSSQIASDVQSTIDTTANPSFALIGDAGATPSGSMISLSVTDTGTAEKTLLEADGNSLDATFTGNTASNLLSVTTGGVSTLSATAGLANLQITDQVGVDGTALTDTATISALSGISATITGDLGTSSFALTDNSLGATSRLNVASNTVVLADGISLDGNATFNAATTTVQETTSTVAAADLFANSVQLSTDSRLSSEIDGTSGIDLTATGSVSNVSVDATGNEIAALSDVNTATTLLAAAGANTLDGIVAQSNVQSLTDATDDTVTAGSFASVTNGTISSSVADTAGEGVSGASIALSSNDVTARATANTADLATVLQGNVLSDGAVGTGAAEAPAITLGTASSTLQASYSSVNRQSVEGEDSLGGAMVEADLTNSAIDLTVGNTTGSTTTSSILAEGNALATTAAANTAQQELEVSANSLDASAAMANQQSLEGGVVATNTGSQVTVGVERRGDATNLTIAGDMNDISSGAVGNTATSRVTVDATSMSPDYLVALGAGDGTAARTVLSLNGQEADSVVGNSGLTLLNMQSTDPLVGSTITSRIADADVTVSFGNGADTVTGALSGIVLSADGNDISTMSRANVASNTLDLAIGSLDMSGAAGTGDGTLSQAGGTNLAALGSSQTNTSGVTSTIDAATAGLSDITASVDASGATVSGSTVSADGNSLTSLASGNSATNTFRLAGTSISTLDASTPLPTLTIDAGAVATSTLTASSAAIAVGNEQSNTGAISSTIANGSGTGTTEISARVTEATSITDATVTADRNSVLAQAVAASGATTTATIDATNIATTALVGSVQTNSGAVTAALGGTGGVTVLAELDGPATGSVVGADGNVLAATSTALTDSTSLALGGTTTASLQGAGDVALADLAGTAGASTVTVTADYGLGESQTNSGAVTTSLTNLTIKAQSDDLTNGAASIGQNLLTAQSTAISATTALSGTAASMTTDAPQTALVVKQANSGAVGATMTGTDLTILAEDITSVDATLTGNSLRSAASAVSANNLSTLSATGAMAGANSLLESNQSNAAGGAVTATLVDTDLAITASSATTSNIEMSLNALQAVAAGLSATNIAGLSATDLSTSTVRLGNTQSNAGALIARLNDTSVSITTGATSGSVAMDGNLLRAGVTAVSAANVAALTGTDIADASAALVSTQTNTGALEAAVGGAALTVSADTVNGAVSLSDNRTVAAATALLATNRVTVDAAAAIEGLTVGGVAMADEGGYAATGTPVATLRSVQNSSGAVSATIDDLSNAAAPKFLVNLTGAVSGSVAVDDNLMVSQARGNVADNAVSIAAGGSIDATTQAVLASSQTRGSGTISATVSGLGTTGQIGVTSTAGTALNGGAISVTGNVVRASGSANTAINAMDIAGATIGAAALQTAATTSSTPELASGSQFAVLNAQTNGSDVTARVEAVDILADAGTGGVSGQVSLNGNMFMADATGNSSITSLRLAAAGGSAAPVSAVNYQSNSADMSASVDSVRLVANGGASAGATSLGGNSILATSNGNIASSSVSAAGSTLTSF